jgi:peptide deformylase
LDSLIEDLADTLHNAQGRFGYGRGIAAPQINVLKKVIFIDMPGFKSALINPRIVQASSERFEVWDSCFSFNLAFFVLVDRHYSIRVEYSDREGNKHVVDAENNLSELLQHEMDHLNGILAIDRMKDRMMIMRSEWEKIFKRI